MSYFTCLHFYRQVATEVSDEGNLENSADLTLNSNISTFFKQSQILNALSDSNCEKTTSSGSYEYCFFCNNSVQNFLTHYNEVHESEYLRSINSLSPNNNKNVFKDISNNTITPLDISLKPLASSCSDKTEHKDTSDYENKVNKTRKNIQKENSKIKRIRLPDFCFFCEKEVHNFSRHVIRNHSVECEVQKILSIRKKDPERKKLLTSLRKKGNYILNNAKCVKPMKKTNHSGPDDYLPCSTCLGFYSRKQLWKHRKICSGNSGEAFSQADAQNFLVRNMKIDEKLKSTIFPRMRADKVSLIAKKDPLICAFGSQYLKTHREKHFVNVVSRKMRELSKMLIEI